MPWVRWLLLILRYGPALVALASRIYDRVEEYAALHRPTSRPIPSIAKGAAWVEMVQRDRVRNCQDPVDLAELVKLRERIWEAKQPRWRLVRR